MDKYLQDIETTAKVLYQLSIDMDYADYSENLQDTLADIEECLYHLRTICENNLNSDYFRTFARCLELITENTEINENIFNY